MPEKLALGAGQFTGSGSVHLEEGDDDHPTLAAGLALVTVADTGFVISNYDNLRSDLSLFLRFRDGTVLVRIVPICVAFH